MTKEEIGRVLKELRLTSGKTQQEVAKIIGRTQQIIGHWETGYSQPDADTLFKLCDIYGASVDDAFGVGFRSKQAPPINKGALALQREFLKLGLIKEDRDLTDKELAVLLDYFKHNADFIKARMDQVNNED